jgi:uncharacterized membrane protein YeaQ/YmgE (transglycosylase-associated protein family)
MDVVTVLVVGLATGLLVSLFVGGAGYGIVRDIAGGAAGALLGGWLLGGSSIRGPTDSGGSALLSAFLGAIGLLLLLRVVHQARRSRSRWAGTTSRSRAWRSIPRAR